MQNESGTQCVDGSELHHWSSLGASRGAKHKRMCSRCGAMAIYSSAGGGWEIRAPRVTR